MEYNHYKYYYNLKLETIILLNQIWHRYAALISIYTLDIVIYIESTLNLNKTDKQDIVYYIHCKQENIMNSNYYK